jgi:hypothetical protein
MLSTHGYIGFNMGACLGADHLIQPPGVPGEREHAELKGTYDSTIGGALGTPGDLGTTSGGPSFDIDAGRDDYLERRAVVDGQFDGGMEDPLFGEGSAAHHFARLRRHGSTTRDALARIRRKRSEGEFPPLPTLSLPTLKLTDDERAVLIDYLDNLMEHVAVGHGARCTYSREHCKRRTSLSERHAREAIEGLRQKRLLLRVGEVRSAQPVKPYLYEPAPGLLDLILEAMPDYRALVEEEPSSSSTRTTQTEEVESDLGERDVEEDLEEIPSENESEEQEELEELAGASTGADVLRPSRRRAQGVTLSDRVCAAPACSNDISHLRAGAQTCSGRCRKALSRSRTRSKALQKSQEGEASLIHMDTLASTFE